ncbi:MAG: FAD-dependent oxidoreductase [Deltaproteobacteria bacterium]|nr:FAD-dependent oxidoreductase [Deltaproteobacteria bacterium]
MSNLVKIKINEKEIYADPSKTILNVARENGIEIPTLCYDPRLPPYGSCLVCVVEIRNQNRVAMSCTTPVADGMEIYTDSELAIDSRQKALSMLLSNHYADCRGPCYLNCPANVDVQGYLALANAGLYYEALELIRETNPLPLTCGRVCVRYCEANCRRKDIDSPVAVNIMKRYISDLEYDKLPPPKVTPKNGKRVAIVGGGPAGLTCGYYLAKEGYSVTIYDKQPKLGGMLRYGIPEYRLPQAILDKEINYLLAHGIEAKNNVKIGTDITLSQLRKDYDAVYIAVGAWTSKPMGIENENHPSILPGIKFLEQVKKDGPPRLEGTVAVIGGGNTAIDAARTALRCGAKKVAILYRRTRNEMPADHDEIEDALAEGVEIQFLIAPKKAVIEGDKLIGVECYKMELGEPDSSGRRKPVPIKGSEFVFECNYIISAIGQEPVLDFAENLKITKWNTIEANPETFATNIEGVFTGGDVFTGPMAAIDAIGAGRKAAMVIDRYVKTGKIEGIKTEFLSKKTAIAELDKSFFESQPKIERTRMPKSDPKERIHNYEEVDHRISRDMAERESLRCLSCGCNSVFDCDLKVFSGEYAVRQDSYKGKAKKYKVDDRHPFIIIDPNKCILCGRCVRYCSDVIGISALGFVNRGFDTVVKPALDKPLQETTCISCGNCIEVCPTGALVHKIISNRPGPYRTIPTDSICSFCSVGCRLIINHIGKEIFYITGKQSEKYIEPELCAKGRFGTYYIKNSDRLYSPIIKGAKVDINNAIAELSESLKKINTEEAVIVVSERMSNEEFYLIGSIAIKLGLKNIISSNELYQNHTINTLDYIGTNFSTAHKEDIFKAEYIIVLGNRETLTYTEVLGFEIKKAISNGSKLIWIGEEPKEFKKYLHKTISVKNISDFINGVVNKIILEGRHSPDSEKIAGFDELTKYQKEENIETSFISELLSNQSKKVILIFNPDYIFGNNYNDMASIINLLIITGRVDKSLILVRNEANGVGYRDIIKSKKFNFTHETAEEDARSLIKNKKAKAIIIFNSDISDLLGYKPELLVVFDNFKSEISNIADYVIPTSVIAESEGSIVNYEGKVYKYQRVFNPLAGYTTFDALSQLLRDIGGGHPSLESVRMIIANSIDNYSSLINNTQGDYLKSSPKGLSFAKMNTKPYTPSSYKCKTTYSIFAEKTLTFKN